MQPQEPYLALPPTPERRPATRPPPRRRPSCRRPTTFQEKKEGGRAMATTPPSWTSREARWQAKQAARAQRQQWKAQMRAQKDYYRSYWRGWHRPTFVGPLILLTIGIIALLMSVGKLDPGEFWGWYARWWPLLLIVMGGLLLAEHFLDWNRPWGGRRSMGGIVWLVILMICLGWVSRNGHLMGPFSWE